MDRTKIAAVVGAVALVVVVVVIFFAVGKSTTCKLQDTESSTDLTKTSNLASNDNKALVNLVAQLIYETDSKKVAGGQSTHPKDVSGQTTAQMSTDKSAANLADTKKQYLDLMGASSLEYTEGKMVTVKTTCATLEYSLKVDAATKIVTVDSVTVKDITSSGDKTSCVADLDLKIASTDYYSCSKDRQYPCISTDGKKTTIAKLDLKQFKLEIDRDVNKKGTDFQKKAQECLA